MLKAKVVFDSSDKVTGLFFLPWCAKWSAPDYVDDEMFGEMEVMIGSGKWGVAGNVHVAEEDEETAGSRAGARIRPT